MEEMKRQIQVAIQGRDMELKILKSENTELKQALDASAQLLNEIFQIKKGNDSASREILQECPRLERGGDLGNEGAGDKAPRAPPGLEGRRRLSEGIPKRFFPPSALHPTERPRHGHIEMNNLPTIQSQERLKDRFAPERQL